MIWRAHYSWRLDPEDEAWLKAGQLGFGAYNFKPSAMCLLLGRHTRVQTWFHGMDCGKLKWSVVAKCCKNLNGFVTVEPR